jgi:hypothetical protein
MKKIIKLTESDLTRIVNRVVMETTYRGPNWKGNDFANPTYDGKKKIRVFKYMDKSYPINSLEKIIHPSYPNLTFYKNDRVVVFAHLNEITPDGKTWFWFGHEFWKTIQSVLSLTYWEVAMYLSYWFNENLGINNSEPTTSKLINDKEFNKIIKNIESGNLEPITYKKIRIPKKYSNLVDDMGSLVKVDDIVELFNKVFDAELPPFVTYNSSKKVFINSHGEEYSLDHTFEILDDSYY